MVMEVIYEGFLDSGVERKIGTMPRVLEAHACAVKAFEEGLQDTRVDELMTTLTNSCKGASKREATSLETSEGNPER